jgi:flavin-binding protein dodecin
LTATTQATVEAAEAETSVRDVGWADVKESREVVEAPPNAGKEAA